MGLVQIPFIYGVNGFVRFKRGGGEGTSRKP